MQSNDDNLRHAGIDALATQPDLLRTIWESLPTETQRSLRTHPSLAFTVADLPPPVPAAATRMHRR